MRACRKDTANQDAYPQHGAQEDGLGFPIARIVVLLSLATAMVSDMAIGPYQGKETGEPALFRELLDRLRRGDIVLADRYYCSYFMVCLLMELGSDFVVRLHQHRTADFRRGQRLGQGDHVVIWTRPQRPSWMDLETYQRMPETLEVREVLVKVRGGWWNWTSAPSSAPWEWTCCVARLRRWFVGKSGRACWHTT